MNHTHHGRRSEAWARPVSLQNANRDTDEEKPFLHHSPVTDHICVPYKLIGREKMEYANVAVKTIVT